MSMPRTTIFVPHRPRVGPDTLARFFLSKQDLQRTAPDWFELRAIDTRSIVRFSGRDFSFSDRRPVSGLVLGLALFHDKLLVLECLDLAFPAARLGIALDGGIITNAADLCTVFGSAGFEVVPG